MILAEERETMDILRPSVMGPRRSILRRSGNVFELRVAVYTIDTSITAI